MRRNRITDLDLFHGNFFLGIALHQPYIALVQGQQSGNMGTRLFGGIAGKHFRTIGKRQQRQTRFRLTGQH